MSTTAPLAPVPTVAGIRATLLTAARILETQGWTKYQSRDDRGRLCVAEAINAAADGHNQDAFFARYEVERFLGVGNPKLTDLVAWQDRPGIGQADVVRLLRNVARLMTVTA
ncbi:MAG: hypothetical protein JWP11_1321 [Frankiales bacterium]|nr:hypothetical protein [Frankiales bacterium]